ncbi:linker histone H1 and H5 family-domain-containing protein [Mycotypha africana]|uniref:linker histone H1 and H5 family-domain-containing protein n=1 Tax=Mycotypha africana TaxID=64632 RepID=UPI0023011725|nr:linker histone H1 and H5 family-domain-containing protein [Mycotypha africana]KAI8971786.1 linker histone H1 and H5 family-domain-containing protein [Mycotypha africana]
MTTESVIQPVEDSRKDAATSIVATTLVASFKKGADHPSYENMITAAILNLKERKGSSRPAIKKYILANYKMNPGNQFDYQISNAIRRGVAKNVFSLPKGKR